MIKGIGTMKFFKTQVYLIVLFIASFINTNTAWAQDETEENKEEKISNIINSRNFVFVAQNALPLGGSTIQLTSAYDVRVGPDTLKSHLPYFGRAFVAPINPADGGIQFTSTNFEYTVQGRRKGGWNITLVPKDNRDVKQMFLNVSDNGYANLQVTSTNRQVISFRGYIKEKHQIN